MLLGATSVPSLCTGMSIWRPSVSQLGDSGGAVNVGCNQQGALALLAEAQSEFGGHGRLAGALQAHEHEHIRRRAGKVKGSRFSQELDELLVDDFDDLLCRG